MGINIQVTLDKPADLAYLIERELKFQTEQKLDSMARFVTPQVREVIQTAIVKSPEYDSLLRGSLREAFGLKDPQPILDGIVEAVELATVVTRLKASAGNLGGLTISILATGFADVFKVPGTTYASGSRRHGVTLVPWLEWLLFGGDKVILVNFELNLARKSRAASRTGRAIMVRKRHEPSRLPPRKNEFQPFRVPPEFAGTTDNNWLTRALGPVAPALQDILQKEVERIFG
ncbi:MAG: hypothetical protein K2R98_19550 [Gemmataceae bacterium]|nr:hypothetical protein [Gemmataceae bacterium]